MLICSTIWSNSLSLSLPYFILSIAMPHGHYFLRDYATLAMLSLKWERYKYMLCSDEQHRSSNQTNKLWALDLYHYAIIWAFNKIFSLVFNTCNCVYSFVHILFQKINLWIWRGKGKRQVLHEIFCVIIRGKWYKCSKSVIYTGHRTCEKRRTADICQGLSFIITRIRK